MGLGLFGGGVGLTKFLVRQGAQVTVTDLRKEANLQESLSALKKLPVTYKLSGHAEADFTQAELIFVNPAVPKESPYLALARKQGIPLDTEINLFFRLCPCPIIGITGTNGKTTTTALTGAILKKTGRSVWVGGNIGQDSLLDKIEKISAGDLAILELSSFQLEDLAAIKKSPWLSVVTNLQPNHLDRHKTMAAYTGAKKNIISYQGSNDLTVLNADDPEVKKWSSECAGKIIWFSRQEEVTNGAFLRDNTFWLRQTGQTDRICLAKETRLPGDFNQENILAAAAIAGSIGIKAEMIASAIREFKGVEHRLEFVTEKKGVKYYNDSIATNPDATIAALNAMTGPTILIAGGYDKNLPFDKLAPVIKQKTRSVILLGATAGKIESLLKKQGETAEITRVSSLNEAVQTGQQQSRQGDTVLFSPACASYDMFRNFAERGQLFKKAVQELPR